MSHSRRRASLRSLSLLLSCIAGSLFVTGCESTGKSNLREPLTTKLSQFKSATVEVKSTVAKPPKRLDEFMAQLESRIIARLRSTNAFARIYPAAAIDSPSEIKILVTITKVRDIDNTDRIMWGAFAGQANSQATVELLEQPSGKLLGIGDIEGKSSGGSVIAGTTPEAVDRVADQVVRLIIENL